MAVRRADSPTSQFEVPGIDSPVRQRRISAQLLVFGIVLLVVALMAVPLLTPDLKAGHYFYICAVAASGSLGLALLVGSYFFREKDKR